MKHFLLTFIAALLLCGSAFAGAWEYQGDDDAHEAWQGSVDGQYILAFTCGIYDAEGNFYVASSEPYEETTSYADSVPTTFTVAGTTVQINGEFEERAGSVSVRYSYSGDETVKIDQLFALIAEGKGDINVKYFDKDLTFSAEGAASALHRVAESANSCKAP